MVDKATETAAREAVQKVKEVGRAAEKAGLGAAEIFALALGAAFVVAIGAIVLFVVAII
jgi:hypothetical protein